MRLILEIISGPAKRKKIWLRQGQTATVGRSHWAEFPLPADSDLADVHFRIAAGVKKCAIECLDKNHPTYVNDREIVSVRLLHGDTIRVGQTTFVTCVEASARSIGDPMQCVPSTDVSNAAAQLRIHATTESGRNILVDAPESVANKTEMAESCTYDLVIPHIVQVALEFTCKSEQRSACLKPGESVTVGRSGKSDIAFSQDSYLSSVHLVIECDEKMCRVRDLESTNGTFLEGQAVLRAPIRTGQRIAAGETSIAVKVVRGSVTLLQGQVVEVASGLMRFTPDHQNASCHTVLTRLAAESSLSFLADMRGLRKFLDDGSYQATFLYDWLPERFQQTQSPSFIVPRSLEGFLSLSPDEWDQARLIGISHSCDHDTLLDHLRIVSRGRSNTWSAADEAHMFRLAFPAEIYAMLQSCTPEYAQFLFSKVTAFITRVPEIPPYWQVLAATMHATEAGVKHSLPDATDA